MFRSRGCAAWACARQRTSATSGAWALAPPAQPPHRVPTPPREAAWLRIVHKIVHIINLQHCKSDDTKFIDYKSVIACRR